MKSWTRPLVITACLTFGACLALTTSASAVPIASVRCTSTGATGSYSEVYPLHRFAPYIENYWVGLLNTNYIRATDGKHPSFAWHISEPAQGPAGDVAFYLYAHLKYYEPHAPNYEDGDYIYWVYQPVPTGEWSGIRVSQVTPSASTSWVCQYRGSNIVTLWWPYATGNQALTQIEVGALDLTSSSYFYMGRHRNVHLRTATGVWSKQTAAAWGNRISAYLDDSPYYIAFNSTYYDWEARR